MGNKRAIRVFKTEGETRERLEFLGLRERGKKPEPTPL